MTIEEILAGESKNVEFKVQRPDKSMKYMKTVVAFANGKGGRIIFGIDDKTREVVGIPEDKVFREIDAITNAISDSCEPTIIPDVYLQNINDKPVIVAEIRTGRRKPYYIKAEGLENGVYIRVSGTTRPADRDMSRELYYECDARSFDSIIRRDIEVTDEDIKSLCEQMKEVAIANCKSNLQRSAVKDVTKNVLLSWGILKKDESEAIIKGLDEVLAEIRAGKFAFKIEDEDIHMAVEKRLSEIIGAELGGRLHTARSRNDQVALDFKFYVLKKNLEISSLISFFLKFMVASSTKSHFVSATITDFTPRIFKISRCSKL